MQDSLSIRAVRRVLWMALASCAMLSSLASAQVSIGINTSLADSALSLVCTGARVDEVTLRGSPVVQAQIAHNSGIRGSATMDAYVEALRALSACAAPNPDPFGVAAILQNRDAFRRKVVALRERRDELSAAVAQRLRPYVPAGFSFHGDVILAVPYFSCGGFAQQGWFFIDVGCLDDDIASDFDAVALLIAHETYHAMQARLFAKDTRELGDREAALASLFSRLLTEGTAKFVAPPESLSARGGRYTRLSRGFAATNGARMPANFDLMTILIEHVLRARDPEAAARQASVIGFNGGTFQEMGYFVGARIARDIEKAWGTSALVCVMQLPPEQFVLAHAAAVGQAAETLRLGPGAVDAARAVARRRGGSTFANCRQ